MNILVTGANGFVGKNLVANLYNIKEGRNQTRHFIIENIFEFNHDTNPVLLDEYCAKADFVFNLAGVNRPRDPAEFKSGNTDFARELLQTLIRHNNKCPVMLSSSIQASLEGRFKGSPYGESKKATEELFFDYGRKTNARVLVYRFPNIFGKWCKPNYNSAVATFCNNIANNLPIQVNDRNTELELVYIDDLMEEMYDAIEHKEHRCEHNDKYCYVPVTHNTTLGEIVDLLQEFEDMPVSKIMPNIPNGSLAKKLYSTYLSYLPREKVAYPLKMNVDNRGTFTELLKTHNAGQMSINVARPGITRGQHWHNSKWEIFIVVSGHGLIQERKIGIDPQTGERYPVIEFEVSGDHIEAIQMLPGYTHNIVNLSDTKDLVTVMWANEQFDGTHPDTFFEMVQE